jgi:hypothetical protein
MACARGCCDSQRTHYRSLVFGTTATKKHTQAFDADMGAYARLRADGVQPPQVAGSAVAENAATLAQAESRPEGTLGHHATVAELQEWTP